MSAVVRSPRRAGTRARRALVAALLLAGVVAGCGDPPKGDARPGAYGPDGRLAGAAPTARPHVVFLVASGLRESDAWPAPNGEGPVVGGPEPALASAGWLRFRSAVAATGSTSSSIALLLSGLPATEFPRVTVDEGSPVKPLIPSTILLAEVLHSIGYRTEALTAGGPLEAATRLDQGFDAYHENWRATGGLDAFDAALARRKDGPLFLFVHAADALDGTGADTSAIAREVGLATRVADLAPPPPPSQPLPVSAGATFLLARLCDPAVHADLRARYQATRVDRCVAAWVDIAPGPAPEVALVRATIERVHALRVAAVRRALAPLFARLEADDVARDTLVVFASARGRAFAVAPERAQIGGRGRLLEEQVHVPLALRLPGERKGADVLACCGLADAVPTVLEACGMPTIPDGAGRSLRSYLAPGAEQGRLVLLADARIAVGPTGSCWLHMTHAIRSRRAKFVADFDLATRQWNEALYDLDADPGEVEPLREFDPVRFGEAFASEVSALQQRLRNQGASIRQIQDKGYPIGADQGQCAGR